MKKGLSQEWLKGIACITMLIDHIGAVFFPQYRWLRVIGRLAFPIYCFLLAEGVAHTKSPVRYGLRLVVGAVLSEFFFDYLFYGGLTMQHQSVMITLLLGFFMALWMKKGGRVLPLVLYAFAAELLGTDYGGWGIALIWLFVITRGAPLRWLEQLGGMAIISWEMISAKVWLGGFSIPIQMFALLAMIPILLYSGKKASSSKLLQWCFYLFYPLHLAVLLAIVVVIR